MNIPCDIISSEHIDDATGLPKGFDTPSKKIEVYVESMITLGRTGQPSREKDIGGTDTMQAGENPTSFRRSESSDKIQRSFDRAGCRKGQAEYVSKRFP